MTSPLVESPLIIQGVGADVVTIEHFTDGVLDPSLPMRRHELAAGGEEAGRGGRGGARVDPAVEGGNHGRLVEHHGFVQAIETHGPKDRT